MKIGNTQYIPYMDPLWVWRLSRPKTERIFFNCWWNSFGTNKIHPKHHPNESIKIYTIFLPHGGEIHGENMRKHHPMGFVAP